MELNLHMERQSSVDSVGGARSIVILNTVRENIHGAPTTSITTGINSVLRRVTLMPCHVEGILVCLHNVKLWAPVTTNFISITVLEWV